MSWKLLKDLIYFIPVGIPKKWTEIKEVNPQKPTVILVSGFGALPSSLRIMRKRLKKDGFNVVLQTLSFQEFFDSISGFVWVSEKLARLVDELRECVGSEQKIFVVAHSAGGLVARYYIQSLKGYHHVNGLVTLATPHRGVWVASLGFLTHLVIKAKCLYDVLPVSSFVKNLNRAQFPSSMDLLSLYSTDDVLCPPKTAQLPPQIYLNDKVKQTQLERISHMEFLFKKQPYQLVRDWLNTQLGVRKLTDDVFSPIHSQHIASHPSGFRKNK